MYKAAEEEITKGLSLPARIILGSFGALFGVSMVLTAPPTEKAVYFYAFGVFCLLVSTACFTYGRVRQFVGSTIGVLLFILSAWYLVTEIVGGTFFSGRRSEPSIMNAVMFFGAFGVPGIAYAVKARFGARSK